MCNRRCRAQTLCGLAATALLAALAAPAWAKNPEQPETAPTSAESTFLDHHGASPFWFSGEANTMHSSFSPARNSSCTDQR